MNKNKTATTSIEIISAKNITQTLKDLQVSPMGVSILEQKCETFLLYIKNIRCVGANILKQDALSVGGDVACPKNVILNDTYFVDVILIANKAQLKELIQKELKQQFGLKELSYKLKDILKTLNLKNKKQLPQIMGVINIDPQSFYKKSIKINNKITKEIKKQIKQGARIIDIGAISSRPNAPKISKKQELERLEFVFKWLKQNRAKLKAKYPNVSFSIDTFRPSVAKVALRSGFDIINDITGGSKKMFKVVAKCNAKIIIMHMQNDPQTMQDNPHYTNVTLEIFEYLKTQVELALKHNIKRENIILDVGIGFGKSKSHNIELIDNISYFKQLQCPILIGASRKSIIEHIMQKPTKDRLSGTLAIHLKAWQNGADILRVHDVVEHIQHLRVYNEFE